MSTQSNIVSISVVALFLAVISHLAAEEPTSPETLTKQIVEHAGIHGGLIVHVGCNDNPELTAALRLNERFVV